MLATATGLTLATNARAGPVLPTPFSTIVPVGAFITSTIDYGETLAGGTVKTLRVPGAPSVVTVKPSPFFITLKPRVE